jgi:hypothetical protein
MRDKRFSFLVPIAILFLSDLFKGFHFSVIPVYGCFALTVWIGTIISKRPNWKYIVLGSIIGSTLFFLITNLPFWYVDLHLYPMTWQGTLESYTAGLEFYRNQLVGDLFYNAVIFGIYYLITTNRKVTPIYIKKH